MINIMHKQIIGIFTNFKKTMTGGLYFSGYVGEGEYKEWHSNNQLFKHCFFKDGSMIDKCETWFDNGQLYQQFFLKKGMKDGEYKEWVDGGTLYKYCFYKDNKKNGEYKVWHENGQPEIHCFYKDNKKYTIEDAKQKFPEGPWL